MQGPHNSAWDSGGPQTGVNSSKPLWFVLILIHGILHSATATDVLCLWISGCPLTKHFNPSDAYLPFFWNGLCCLSVSCGKEWDHSWSTDPNAWRKKSFLFFSTLISSMAAGKPLNPPYPCYIINNGKLLSRKCIFFLSNLCTALKTLGLLEYRLLNEAIAAKYTAHTISSLGKVT